MYSQNKKIGFLLLIITVSAFIGIRVYVGVSPKNILPVLDLLFVTRDDDVSRTILSMEHNIVKHTDTMLVLQAADNGARTIWDKQDLFIKNKIYLHHDNTWFCLREGCLVYDDDVIEPYNPNATVKLNILFSEGCILHHCFYA